MTDVVLPQLGSKMAQHAHTRLAIQSEWQRSNSRSDTKFSQSLHCHDTVLIIAIKSPTASFTGPFPRFYTSSKSSSKSFEGNTNSIGDAANLPSGRSVGASEGRFWL